MFYELFSNWIFESEKSLISPQPLTLAEFKGWFFIAKLIVLVLTVRLEFAVATRFS